MTKRGIISDSILGTLFIVSLILLFHFFTSLGDFSLFDPIGDAIGDVEMTDVVFSNIRENPEFDDDIVLVNIGNLTRREIAKELSIINMYKPKVVGIDSYFWTLKQDSLGDILLNRALSDIDNLVMVNKLIYNPSKGIYDSIRYSHTDFNVGVNGFANLETTAQAQHKFKVCRSFPPTHTVGGQKELSFAVQVAGLVDSSKAWKFVERNSEFEIINYRGNIIDYNQTNYGGRFIALDVEDVMERKFMPELIENKIVIFGYLGDDFNDRSWEDKFYTPLNVKYAGRSNPDMFGAVIHANIISMILNEDYIGRQSKLSGIVTAVLLCFVVVYFFTIIYYKIPHWYDGLTKFLQLVIVLFILTINVFLFHWFNYKANLTLATIMVALAGDSLEVCYGLIKNLFRKGRNRLAIRAYNYK